MPVVLGLVDGLNLKLPNQCGLFLRFKTELHQAVENCKLLFGASHGCRFVCIYVFRYKGRHWAVRWRDVLDSLLRLSENDAKYAFVSNPTAFVICCILPHPLILTMIRHKLHYSSFSSLAAFPNQDLLAKCSSRFGIILPAYFTKPKAGYVIQARLESSEMLRHLTDHSEFLQRGNGWD